MLNHTFQAEVILLSTLGFTTEHPKVSMNLVWQYYNFLKHIYECVWLSKQSDFIERNQLYNIHPFHVLW